jgi:hypothetical protein
MTILLTTHYLDEAERLSDRIAIMRAGEIVALGTPKDLVAGLGSELVELRVPRDAEAALASMRSGGIAGADAFAVGSTLIVPVGRNAPQQMIADVHDAGIAMISAYRPSASSADRSRSDGAANGGQLDVTGTFTNTATAYTATFTYNVWGLGCGWPPFTANKFFGYRLRNANGGTWGPEHQNGPVQQQLC